MAHLASTQTENQIRQEGEKDRQPSSQALEEGIPYEIGFPTVPIGPGVHRFL